MHADCFIIDEWLPRVSGHAICLLLKAKVQTSLIPVVLIAPANLIERTANLCEADAIIRKSCYGDDLVRVISLVLSKERTFPSGYGQL
jgi:DNA-binding NarL/FixJ family response regulator